MAPVDYIHEDPFCAVCNGTHDSSTTSIYKKPPICRYYQTSSCRRGSNCPFAHVPISGQVETPTLSHPAYQAENMYIYHPLGSTPVYRPLDSQTYPLFLWKPYPPLSPSVDLRYGFVHQAEILHDYPDDKSDPSSAESSSTVISMDCQLRTAYDTARLEFLDSATIQGTASPPDDLGANSSPGYVAYGYPVYSGVKVGCDHAVSVQGSMVPIPSPSSLPLRDDSRKKPLAYKTKPCKFYAANGKCTSGERCTFIHDPESQKNVGNSRTELAPPTDAKLPPKPVNKYDECRARDFYPITWRVIGGGVMMGGQRQICPAFTAGHCKYGDDCKLAHETEVETDPVGFVEPKNEPIEKGDGSLRRPGKSAKRGRPSSQRPKAIKVTSPEIQQPAPFPSTTPHAEKPDGSTLEGTEIARKKGHEVTGPSGRDGPTSPVHRRTRSMSMILTSPPPLDTTQSNYAAEL